MSASARRYDDHAEIHLDYSAAAVAALKAAVPHYARAWDATDKHWTIIEPHVKAAFAAIRPHVGRVLIADLRTRRLDASKPTGWAQALHDALPARLRRPAYRALSRVIHPDIGGDVTLTQQLNDVFSHSHRDAS